MSQLRPLRPPCPFWVAAFVLTTLLTAGEPVPVLRSARAVRELSAVQAAEARAAELTGVVLGLSEPEGASFVLQDESDSLYLVGPSRFVRSLAPGDVVTVRGRTRAGGFAPILRVEEGRKTGVVPLPPPRAISSDELFTGGLDAQWIAVRGIVRGLRPFRSEEMPRGPEGEERTNGQADPLWRERMKMTLAVGDRLVSVQLCDRADADRLVDAEVEIHGLCFNQHNAARQFLNPLLFVPRGVAIRVVRPPPAAPFAGAVIPAANLFQFDPDGLSLHRVHIAGVVLHQKRGVGLWLRDGDRGLFVESEARTPARPGDRVEVAGFPARGVFSPILTDAVHRAIETGPEPEPVRLLDRTEAVRHDGDLVVVHGTLLGQRWNETDVVLQLAWADTALDVQIAAPVAETHAKWLAPGAQLAVTGICLVSSEHAAPLSGVAVPDKFRLLARRPADIALLRAAPWWTESRVAIALAIVAGALAVVLAAVFVVSRRKLARERALRAVKASEYAARLAERSRMARDIHDNVAQGLGALSLQLQLAERGPLSGEQTHHLALARQLVSTSLDEVRGFIRDLRTQTPRDGDLPSVLEEQLRHAVDGVELRPVFECIGEARRWPAPVEAQVLRIAQEAMANAVQHAGARTLSLTLRFAPAALIVTVIDDGRGFDPAADWARRGHFGVLGMRERAALIGATLEIDRAESGGTRVRLTVPNTARLSDDFTPP